MRFFLRNRILVAVSSGNGGGSSHFVADFVAEQPSKGQFYRALRLLFSAFAQSLAGCPQHFRLAGWLPISTWAECCDNLVFGDLALGNNQSPASS